MNESNGYCVVMGALSGLDWFFGSISDGMRWRGFIPFG